MAKRSVTEEQKAAAEAQIDKNQKVIDYDTREYPVEVIIQKYLKDIENDNNDFFIPDYQREHSWSDDRQSRFIESVLMGLPIPLLFFADVAGQEGRAEIVDGSQRVRTLARFVSGELELTGLERLDKLNGLRYHDLSLTRQRRFGRHTLRMIELREGVDEDARRDIFSRINTGSLVLNDMEVRWGTEDGPFLHFIRDCSRNPLFTNAAPLSPMAVKRREPQEFVLRFFAYLNNYKKFDRSVVGFLNDYLDRVSKQFSDAQKVEFEEEWLQMLTFVSDRFPSGFVKADGHVRTPRIRFEAISVGVALALRENPETIPNNLDWLNSETFLSLMRSDASNSRPKVIKRIEYVRDNVLGTYK
ncbi:MAG: DUF262 domain-containing protein [bacterium]|nr:DUF262 domain-containing protein [bacterium]